MLNFIKNIISGIGVKGGLAILAIILPVILLIFKPEKAYNFLKKFMDIGGQFISAFLNGKLGEALEQIIEKYFVKVLIWIPMFLLLDFILAIRKDDKENLLNEVNNAKQSLLNIIKK